MSQQEWSLKQKMYAAVVIAAVVMAALIWMQAKQTNEAEGTGIEAETSAPEPLVVENPDWEPRGVYAGTVEIAGPRTEGRTYEDLMYVEMDGKYLRVTCTDAVRSRFGDVF